MSSPPHFRHPTHFRYDTKGKGRKAQAQRLPCCQHTHTRTGEQAIGRTGTGRDRTGRGQPPHALHGLACAFYGAHKGRWTATAGYGRLRTHWRDCGAYRRHRGGVGAYRHGNGRHPPTPPPCRAIPIPPPYGREPAERSMLHCANGHGGALIAVLFAVPLVP